MSEVQHTPGPWVFEDRGNHNLLGADGTVVVDTEWGTAIRNYMDARLIAAAPEMLAALKLAESALTSAGGWADSITLADLRAAISAAEGRS